eukprot:UN07299
MCFIVFLINWYLKININILYINCYTINLYHTDVVTCACCGFCNSKNIITIQTKLLFYYSQNE